jgi:hypothetical protein
VLVGLVVAAGGIAAYIYASIDQAKADVAVRTVSPGAARHGGGMDPAGTLMGRVARESMVITMLAIGLGILMVMLRKNPSWSPGLRATRTDLLQRTDRAGVDLLSCHDRAARTRGPQLPDPHGPGARIASLAGRARALRRRLAGALGA